MGRAASRPGHDERPATRVGRWKIIYQASECIIWSYLFVTLDEEVPTHPWEGSAMTKLHTPSATCENDEISIEEERELAEAEAQRELGITFEEFKRRWNRGEYRDNPDPKITDVAFWLH